MAKLEDFGSKIGGARKDFLARGINAQTFDEMNAIERDQLATKDYIWPKPDYDALIASGVPIETVFRIKLLRDRIPTKIVTSGATWKWREAFNLDERRRAFVTAVNILREAASDIKGPADFARLATSYAGLDAEQRRALDMVPTKRVGLFAPFCDVTPHRSHVYLYEKALRQGWPSGRRAVRRKKIDYPERVLAENPLRTSDRDFRSGRNATPEMFMEAFNLKGGEFGNWVDQTERQKSLNMAFDAFCDLAEVLEIPKTQIGLGGTLSLAFGARGSGGVAAACAHYERGRRVINLTKPHGVGALCHEWFHALDHRLATLRGNELVFATEMKAKEGDVELASIRDALKTVCERPTTPEEFVAGVVRCKEKSQRGVLAWAANPFYGEAKDKVFKPEGSLFSKWSEVREKLLVGDITAMESLTDLYREAHGHKRALPKESAHAVVFHLSVLSGIDERLAQGVTTEKRPTNFLQSAQKWDSYKSKPYYSQPCELAARAFEAFIVQ